MAIDLSQIEVTPATLKGDLFSPPDKAIDLEGCEDRRPPKMLHSPQPQFPEPERKSRTPGTVTVYALVDMEGKVASHQVVSASSEGFARNATDEMKKWKFQPATCGGRPINCEITVEFSFDLH